MSNYGTEGALSEYATATGRPAPSNASVALTVASSWLDGTYGTLFPGVRSGGYAQDRAWPRRGAMTVEGFPIPDNVVPPVIEQATYEAALRHSADPGSLAPDRGTDGVIAALKAGSVEIKYADPTKVAEAGLAGPVYPVIDGILASVLSPLLPAAFAV